jgi:hypothetical protein
MPKAAPKSPLAVGAAVLIRTVTFYYSGRVILLTPEEIVLEDAAWIADTGRFSTALKSGTFNEVEPFVGAVSIARASVVDVTPWTHDLPKVQK